MLDLLVTSILDLLLYPVSLKLYRDKPILKAWPFVSLGSLIIGLALKWLSENLVFKDLRKMFRNLIYLFQDTSCTLVRSI